MPPKRRPPYFGKPTPSLATGPLRSCLKITYERLSLSLVPGYSSVAWQGKEGRVLCCVRFCPCVDDGRTELGHSRDASLVPPDQEQQIFSEDPVLSNGQQVRDSDWTRTDSLASSGLRLPLCFFSRLSPCFHGRLLGGAEGEAVDECHL